MTREHARSTATTAAEDTGFDGQPPAVRTSGMLVSLPVTRKSWNLSPWFVGALVSLCSLGAPAIAQAAHCVVIVSIDGLRPDVALRADMPALRSLMARGSFTMYAVTTDVAVTLPSHTSMLTGVPPAKHGILYNDDPRSGQRLTPAWPTLMDIAHRAGFTTGLAAGKSKFSVLADPGTLDLRFVPARGKDVPDSVVAVQAASWIESKRPDVLFVHLAGPDLAGHANGWGSPAQVRAVGVADRALGHLLAALAKRPANDSTLVIVTADHGGAGRTHGGTDARSRFIPWVIVGPGVRANYDLTQIASLAVRTEDTFATACAWLRMTPPKPVDGRVVSEAFAH